jgi:hypothetical protein
MSPKTDDSLITVEERAAARRLADKLGDRHAAEALGMSPDALLRILAGRRIRRGTASLLRERLSALRAA